MYMVSFNYQLSEQFTTKRQESKREGGGQNEYNINNINAILW